jgi:hypothetical protein
MRVLRDFRNGVVEDSVLLGYDAVSQGDRFPTFRGNIVDTERREPITLCRRVLHQKNRVLRLTMIS